MVSMIAAVMWLDTFVNFVSLLLPLKFLTFASIESLLLYFIAPAYLGTQVTTS
jgi:hypothetical protein